MQVTQISMWGDLYLLTSAQRSNMTCPILFVHCVSCFVYHESAQQRVHLIGFKADSEVLPIAVIKCAYYEVVL